MTYRRNLLIIFAIFLISGCSSRINEVEISAAVLEVLTAQAEAWNRGNIEEFMEGYWKSENLSFTSGGVINRGYDGVLQRYKTNYSPETMGILTFSDLEITPVSNDAAFVLGTFKLEREPDNPEGKFTLLFRKFEEGWKVVHDHTSQKVN